MDRCRFGHSLLAFQVTKKPRIQEARFRVFGKTGFLGVFLREFEARAQSVERNRVSDVCMRPIRHQGARATTNVGHALRRSSGPKLHRRGQITLSPHSCLYGQASASGRRPAEIPPVANVRHDEGPMTASQGGDQVGPAAGHLYGVAYSPILGQRQPES
jgi:hypothetical protein